MRANPCAHLHHRRSGPHQPRQQIQLRLQILAIPADRIPHHRLIRQILQNAHPRLRHRAHSRTMPHLELCRARPRQPRARHRPSRSSSPAHRRPFPHAFLQRRFHPRHHVGPIVALTLPEQPQRRIPWTIVAPFQPAEIRRLRQHHPYRLAQRSRQMRHRRIDAQHQIQLTDHRRRIAEILQLRAHIQPIHSRRHRLSRLLRSRPLLQRYKPHPRNLQYRPQHR